MSYTLAILVKKVKDRLRDDAYDEESIRDYLNDAQDEILGEDKYPFLERMDVYDGGCAGTLSLPLDYQATISLFAHQEGRGHARHQLEFISPSDFFGAETGSFWTFTVFSGQIFYRMPERVGVLEDEEEEWSDYSIMHLYLAKPKRMVESNDSPIIPEEYSEALIYGALARAERERDNFDYAQVYENKESDIILNMKYRFGLRQLGNASRARLPLHGVLGGDNGSN